MLKKTIDNTPSVLYTRNTDRVSDLIDRPRDIIGSCHSVCQCHLAYLPNLTAPGLESPGPLWAFRILGCSLCYKLSLIRTLHPLFSHYRLYHSTPIHTFQHVLRSSNGSAPLHLAYALTQQMCGAKWHAIGARLRTFKPPLQWTGALSEIYT